MKNETRIYLRWTAAFFLLHLFLQVFLFFNAIDDRGYPAHPGYTPFLEQKVDVCYALLSVIGFPLVTLLWIIPLHAAPVGNTLWDIPALTFIRVWFLWLIANSLIWATFVNLMLKHKRKKTEQGVAGYRRQSAPQPER